MASSIVDTTKMIECRRHLILYKHCHDQMVVLTCVRWKCFLFDTNILHIFSIPFDWFRITINHAKYRIMLSSTFMCAASSSSSLKDCRKILLNITNFEDYDWVVRRFFTWRHNSFFESRLLLEIVGIEQISLLDLRALIVAPLRIYTNM